MKFIELYNCLSTLYPKCLSCDWDNDGIMCADDLNREVKSVLIALDVTAEVVDYAINNGFDTVISHHPLVFRSQKSITPEQYTPNKLINLIKNGVGVMSFHTRLDAAKNGVNDTLCQILDLQAIEIDENERIGRVGYLTSPKSLSDFAVSVKKLLNCPFVLASGAKQVSRVYVVGGDGKDMINNAISLGADTILTGRASYNTSVDATDMGINIVEAGHFYTENPVCKSLYKEILSLLPSARIEIYNSNSINVF